MRQIPCSCTAQRFPEESPSKESMLYTPENSALEVVVIIGKEELYWPSKSYVTVLEKLI